jgi:NADPH:quinone reductase-like Zn-dependent oxidoreductase
MRGVVLIKNDQGQYQLVLKDIPIPLPGKGEVLVRIQCAAVNRMDLIDNYSLLLKKVKPGTVVGQEICGTIADFGEECSGKFRLGEQVIGYIPEGGYAEFVVVEEKYLMKAPFGILDMTVLSAVSVAYLTAYHIAFQVAKIEYGEIVLIHAGAGNIGMALIQLLSKRGIPVIATVRSSSKKKICEDCGAHLVLNLSETDGKYARAILDKFQQGVNVILDCIGNQYINENILSMEHGGRIVYYGTLSGGEIRDILFLQKLIESELSIVTTTSFLSQPIKERIRIMDIIEHEYHLLEEIAKGNYLVPVYQTMPIEQFVEAHQIIRRNENIGKIVLMITSTLNAVDELQQELMIIRKKEYSHKMMMNKK